MDKPLTTPSEKQGEDAMLAKLLRQDGSGFDVAGATALVAGVLAAAPNAIAADWVRLVAPHPSPELIAALSALAASLSAAPPAPGPGPAERLALLRAELARRGVHGFLVPRADEHQGEYVPRCAQRLAWLTGFTGSAGLAAVLPKAAAVFIDGRYTLQARAEVDPTLYAYRHLSNEPAHAWVAETLQPGEILAYDPRLHTLGEVERFRAAAVKAGGRLAALSDNPLDAIWPDRPPPPLAPVVPHDVHFAGESAETKRQQWS
jgi:Xaa-Pro aminopeptidase